MAREYKVKGQEVVQITESYNIFPIAHKLTRSECATKKEGMDAI